MGALDDATADGSIIGGNEDGVDSNIDDAAEADTENDASAAVLAGSTTDCGEEDAVVDGGGGGGAAVGGGGGAEVGAFLREPVRLNTGRTFDSSVDAVARDETPSSEFELIEGVAKAWVGGGGGGALGGCMLTFDAVLEERTDSGVERAREREEGTDTVSSA